MKSRLVAAVVSLSLIPLSATGLAQAAPLVALDRPTAATDFPIAANGKAAAIFVDPANPETVRVAAEAFAADVERVTGVRPEVMSQVNGLLPADIILVCILGHSSDIDRLVATHKLNFSAVAGKWESAVTAVVPSPEARGHRALVIAGSDRRGAVRSQGLQCARSGPFLARL